jgi:hypothetical protein
VAHTFLKPETIVSMGLGLLQRELILPRLVTRLAAADFVGKKDDTENIRIPAVLAAREYGWRNDRGSEIVTDDLLEQSIPVVLNKDPYSAVSLTDEQLTLDIRDFAGQVLNPQIRAVAEKLESYIATVMEGGTYAADDIEVTASDDFYSDVLLPARKALNIANVPTQGRVVVLGANVEEWALDNEIFKRADASGSTSVLDEAIIGRKSGFTIVGNCNSIDPDLAFAFHPTAYGFVNMAPVVPQGASFGASQTYEGLAMRWLRDYDAPHLRDRSVVSAFAGAVSVEDGRDGSGDLTDENIRSVKIVFGSGS